MRWLRVAAAIIVLALLCVPGLAGAADAGTAVASIAGTAAGEPDAEPAPEVTAAPLGSAPVLLIMDASGSMNADDGTGQPKIEAARHALTSLIDGLGEESVVGLRAYGHRTPTTDRDAGCVDTELLVPVGSDNTAELQQAIDGLSASGFTPIGASLWAALEDLPEVEGRTVVLVSDGIDTCAPPGACEVAQQIIGEGVNLRVETVGFQVDADAVAELQCIAEVTGGTFRPAESAEDLARELRAQIATGTPVEGGPTPAQARVIGPGQYVDVLPFPEERWYAVQLDPGDRVRATAAVIGDAAGTPVLPGAQVEMVLAFGGDVIGVTPCATDVVTGIGPFAQNLAVDGLEVAGGTVCSDPGTYVIGLRYLPADTRDGERELRGVSLPIELFVAVTSNAVDADADADAVPATKRPELAAPPPVDPGRQPMPTSYYLLAVGGFGVLGALGGSVVPRRLGP